MINTNDQVNLKNINFQDELVYLIKESIIPFLVEENLKDVALNASKEDKGYHFKTIADTLEINKNDLI